MNFIRVYGRVIALLGRDLRSAGWLCLMSLFIASIQFIEPLLFGRAIQMLPSLPRAEASLLPNQLVPLLAIWGGLSAVGILLSFASSFIAERVSHRNRLKAMSRYHEHVLSLPLPFHQATHSGYLMKTLVGATEALLFSWLFFLRDQLPTILSVLVLLPLTFLLNWHLAICLVVLMVLFTVITTVVIYRTEEGQQRAEQYNLKMAGAAQDAISNVAVVQSFNAITLERTLFAKLAGSVLAHQFPVLKSWAVLNMLARSASTLTILSILVCGTWLYMQDLAQIADIVSFMGFATLLIGRLESSVLFAGQLFLRLPVIRDYFAILDTASSVPEPKQARPMAWRHAHVMFEDVCFAYQQGEPVLHNVSFEAKAGSVVALVGHTGAGKTTAMALLQRHWDPSAGRILINGTDLREIPIATLRKHIGVVFQDSLLFNRTIRDNLLIAKPEARREELEHVCRLADAHEFISRMPRGYDTLLGERGMTLSGGQKQRLAIARALLKDPPILILDEATSALDAATEAQIAAALHAVMHGRTTFIVAHRLSTIRSADEVLVFHDGRILERGTFDRLVHRKGGFSALVHAQLESRGDRIAAE